MKKHLLVMCAFLLTKLVFADVGEGISTTFTLDNVDPNITLVNPSGGETYLTNQEVTINWSTSDSNLQENNVSVFFSSDNGINYETITSNEGNDSSYNWTVPNTSTNSGLIKITVYDQFGNMGQISNTEFFSIIYEASYGISSVFSLDNVDPVVELLSHNDGQTLYIGSTENILWNASDNHFSQLPIDVLLMSNGTYTDIISENEFNNGNYNWQVASYQSENCYLQIKATDQFGNVGEDFADNAFTIMYVPPQAPTYVSLAIDNDTDAIIGWDAVTQNIHGEEITPDGYIVLYNEVPEEEENSDFYYFLTATSELSTIHHRVAEFRQQQFYRVLAYVNHSEGFSNYLTSLQNGKDNQVSWTELQDHINK